MFVSPLPSPFYMDPQWYWTYAGNSTNNANNFLAQLGQLATSLVPPVINPVFPSGGSAPAISIATPPSYISFTWSVPNLPNPFTGTLNIDPYLPATFDQSPPALVFGSAPPLPTDSSPTAPTIDTAIPFPTEPTLNFPAPPSLLSINTYQFDGVTIPSFNETVPVMNIAEPSIMPYIPGSGYTSSLLTKVVAVLDERLNGGTGLPPEVEQAIWDRGREREVAQLADSIAELERMEALGYAFPPGVYLDARLKLTNEYAAKSYGHSREVMIKQAELEQANIRQALQDSISLESKLIDAYNMTEQRVLEGAKYATQAGVSIYNAKVEAYKAYVDTYRVKAAIYEAQIKGEMAKVEAYKAEVEAERAKAEVNTALVQQYKTQIDAAMSMVELYKAELMAVQTKAEIEKLKIEIYGEEVKAFASKIGAYTAQVEGYRASVQAEATKQEAYKSAVDAYSAQVGAQVKVIDAKIAEYKGLLEAKQTEYEGYKVAVTGESERVKALAATNNAIADTYRALVTGQASYNETLTKQWQVSLDQAQRVSDIANNAAKANADLYLTARGIASDAAKAGAQVCAQLGAAALNAVNWSTSFSVSNSTQESGSYSESLSNSNSVSVNNNYNYNT